MIKKYNKNSKIPNINLDYLQNLSKVQSEYFEKANKTANEQVKKSKKKFQEKREELKQKTMKNDFSQQEKQKKVQKLTQEILKEAIEPDNKNEEFPEKQIDIMEEQRLNFEKHLPFLRQIKYQNTDERDERKSEKRRKFQVSHIVQILHNFHLNEKSMPIDRFIHYYLGKHREIDNRKNRITISNDIYDTLRWKILINYFYRQLNKQYYGIQIWEEKFRIFQTLNVNTVFSDESIPKNVRCSCPSYLFDLLVTDYGEEEAFQLAKQMNHEAPTFGRVNPLKIPRNELIVKLKEKNIHSLESTTTKFGLVFSKRHDFRSLEEFSEGYFEIQDESSQLTSELVEAKPGDQVMDYCAGSGGKTLAFAHKLEGKGQIYVCDVRKSTLTQAKKRLKRAGIQNVQPLEIGSSTFFDKLKKKINWLLLDVPCSGSGTLRRNPDAKYKIEKEWLEDLINKQREIFENAIKYLRDDGKIVYSTCSILKCENEKQIEYFLKKYDLNLEKTIKNIPENEDSMDGFFAAVLTKK
eukprot:gene819-9069_t